VGAEVDRVRTPDDRALLVIVASALREPLPTTTPMSALEIYPVTSFSNIRLVEL